MKITGTVERLLYTPEEAAEALGIGRCKLYELIADGQLYSVKIGALPTHPCRRAAQLRGCSDG